MYKILTVIYILMFLIFAYFLFISEMHSQTVLEIKQTSLLPTQPRGKGLEKGYTSNPTLIILLTS